MACVEGLRNDGHTSMAIADQLNEEGFHPPSREKFDALTVRRLLSRSRPLSGRVLPEPSQWSPRELAQKLGMPIRTLHAWLRRGWLQGEQSAGSHGRWILWADVDELLRLKQLRQDGLRSSGLPAAAELTTPKPQPNN